MQLILGNRSYINDCILNNGFKIINNKYGKPSYENSDIFFNKSHTKDLSVAIIDNKSCGIDIEKIRTYNQLMVNKICSDEEITFLNGVSNKDYYFTLLWVLKESFLKCIGIGLSVPMKKINFIKDNKINLEMKNFKMKYITLNKYIIAICRKG